MSRETQDKMVERYWKIVVALVMTSIAWGTLNSAVNANAENLAKVASDQKALQIQVNGAILQSAKDIGEISGDIKAIKVELGIKDKK